MGRSSLGYLTITLLETEFLEQYTRLKRQVKMYNEWRPFHEDTGERYSTEERHEFQRKNVKTLKQIAKQLGMDNYVRFNLRETEITMLVERRIVSR